MGEVWRARDTVLGREVAVKILKREYADDPTFRARFEAEARHAAGLHHPGIASVFDYGLLKEGNTPYLVMELVNGKPLSDLLVDGQPFDPEQARLLALQIAEALAVAHEAGVVHRDVKPGNLLVTPDGRVKITDFGIARATGSVAFTQTGQIVGTPQYLSPEQARGDAGHGRERRLRPRRRAVRVPQPGTGRSWPTPRSPRPWPRSSRTCRRCRTPCPPAWPRS